MKQINILGETQQVWQISMKTIGCLFFVLGLSACASSGDKQKSDQAATDKASTEQVKTLNSTSDKGVVKSKAEADARFDSRVGSAITSPLSDFNLMRTEIPAVLISARKAPYVFPVDAGCIWFTTEIQGLDLVLGPDLDAVKLDADGNVVERELGNATVNALKSFTEGFVPFRAWVRRLTGADSHAREVAAAGMAGIVRRSYLKGVAHARACRLEPVQGSVPVKTPDSDSAEK
ncbi:MAG: hypothetical protein K2X63_06900 [Burkholderiaceae bacterium]|nr:hypothetical protein [Burkholderiaceae bacterium]